MSSPRILSDWIKLTDATRFWIAEDKGWQACSTADAFDGVLGLELSTQDLRNDSRTVGKDDVYVALKGTQVDGHQFIGDAIKNGASLVLCEVDSAPVSEVSGTKTPVLCIPNLRSELGRIAQSYYGNPAQKLSIIAVTGTNGKTTISTLIWQALSALGMKAGLLGTIGGFIGNKSILLTNGTPQMTTSDAIQLAVWMKEMVQEGVSHLVMEASSHALDQARLNGLGISVGIFSNLSHDHLDYHGTMEAYADAKKRLFDGLLGSSTAIVNTSDAWGTRMVSDTRAEVWQIAFEESDSRVSTGGSEGEVKSVEIVGSIGSSKNFTLRYSDLSPSEGNGLEVMIHGDSSSVEFTSPIHGKFNAMNLAEAYLACKALGFREEAILEVMPSLSGAPGRLERIQTTTEQEPLVLVDYAHTPDALEKVSAIAAELKKSRESGAEVWIIFGCGGNRDRAKRPVMAEIAQRYADRVIVTSDNPRNEDPELIIDEVCTGFRIDGAPFERFVDRAEAIEYAILNAEPSDIVLIAGKGHETGQIIGDRTLPLDDRKEALAALQLRAKNMEEV